MQTFMHKEKKYLREEITTQDHILGPKKLNNVRLLVAVLRWG